jgi:alpha-galactosidase
MKQHLSRNRYLFLWALALHLLTLATVQAVTPNAGELAQSRQWAETAFGPANPVLFSFLFDGKPSGDILKNWERKTPNSPLPGGGELRELTFRDPQTGLQAQVSAQVFADFPAVEWVVRFKNTGKQDSPLLENIQALDSLFEVPASTPPTLHWAKGGVSTFDDFAPQTVEMKAGAKFALQPNDGRSSSEILPFFNLAPVSCWRWDGAGAGPPNSSRTARAPSRFRRAWPNPTWFCIPAKRFGPPACWPFFMEGTAGAARTCCGSSS